MSDVRNKGSSRGARGERNDDAILRAGIAEVFARLGEMAPQVARLQHGLLSGLSRAQELEIRRLSRIDENDPRIQIAERRAQIAASLLVEVEKASDATQKVAAGAVAGNMFHGYVLHAEGEPAVGYTVVLMRELDGGKDTLRSKTDDMGYFRIDFDKPSRKKKAEFAEVSAKMVERLERTGDTVVESPAGAAGAAAPADNPTLRVNVDVIDPKKKVVFRDPSPPAFDDTETVFRYYPLIDF